MLQFLLYRCVTGTAPVYVSEKFESSHRSDIITRSQTNLEMFRQSIAYQGPRIWNGLAICVRRAGNIEKF